MKLLAVLFLGAIFAGWVVFELLADRQHPKHGCNCARCLIARGDI